jgi:hypothetical protein
MRTRPNRRSHANVKPASPTDTRGRGSSRPPGVHRRDDPSQGCDGRRGGNARAGRARRSPSGSPPATCTTRPYATSAHSCTEPSSRTSTPTPSGSTTAPGSTAPSRSTTPARTFPTWDAARLPRSSAASPTGSTANSTRSQLAPRGARSRSGSPPRCATAPATAGTPSRTTGARTSPPASG